MPGYQHPTNGIAGWPTTFEAINLAVIPDRSLTGNTTDVVIAWDKNYHDPNTLPDPVVAPWDQRFVVGNPETHVFANRTVTIPMGPGNIFYGDLFCTGQVWTPDGRLFVAGGNTKYENLAGGSPGFQGSRFVGFWDPMLANVAPNFGWDFSLLTSPFNSRPMRLRRWYPTVTLISNHLIMVSGGSSDTTIPYAQDPAFNTYEVFDLDPLVNDWERDPNSTPPNLPRLYNGPTSPLLAEYPRLHLLSNRSTFLSGQWADSARVLHVSNQPVQIWTGPFPSGNARDFGSSILVPNVGNVPSLVDEVMGIGGGTAATGVLNTSRRILAGATNPMWSGTQTMHSARMTANATLAPNGDVVLIGGCSDYYPTSSIHIPVRTTEIWDRINGWQKDTDQAASRMYHSVSGTLRSGRIVSAGGDIRVDLNGTVVDWEVYEPRSMANGQTVPVFAGAWANPGYMSLAWATEYYIEYAPLPVGVAISRVVLMRPCSTTHHSDMDQRYVELQDVTMDDEVLVNTVHVKTPRSPNWSGPTQSITTPPGFLMAFLITTEGTCSHAKSVKLP